MNTRILKLLRSHESGLSHGDIATALGEPQEVVLQALNVMQHDFEVFRTVDDLWHSVFIADSSRLRTPRSHVGGYGSAMVAGTPQDAFTAITEGVDAE